MRNNRRIIIAVISIVVTISLAIFLFNQEPDFIKVSTSDSLIGSFEESTFTPIQNFIKNIMVSLFFGGSIYTTFYSIPNEYKKANKKRKIIIYNKTD